MFKKKSYIKYENNNPMWNDGYITVYKEDELIERIDVTEFLAAEDRDPELYCADSIIEHLQEKHGIKKVKKGKEGDWR